MAGDFQHRYSIRIHVILRVSDAVCFALNRFLNRAMKAFDATVVVPTNFVLFTISAITSGMYSYTTTAICEHISSYYKLLHEQNF